MRKMLGYILMVASLMAASVLTEETEIDQIETKNAVKGIGLFALGLREDESIGILWKDDILGNDNVNMFVKTE